MSTRRGNRTALGRGLTVVFSGMLAGVPRQGGATWAVLQYLLGLTRLGHRVVFIEPVEEEVIVPAGSRLEESANTRYFREVVDRFGLANASALVVAGTRETVGLSYDALRREASRADVVLNVSGMLRDEELIGAAGVRVYLDLDPGFNQLWYEAEGIDVGFDHHTHFVTVGQAIGEPDCTVPDCGREWKTTLPPAVLDHWPPSSGVIADAFTTVANWRGYGSIEHDGVFLGQKAHSLRDLMEVPTLCRERFRLALAIHPAETRDLDALERNGWEVIDPDGVAGTPDDYSRFIRGSKGELGIAKSGYVITRCGWFSDRSACYLASGRPVVAQETGFSRFLPTGEGLFSFGTAEEVGACIEDLNGDYERHARAARSLAEAHLDSDRVLSRLLEDIGAPI